MYSVGIYVYHGKAYLPAQAKFESGIWTDIDPVFTASLNLDELVAAIQNVIAAGHPILPEPTREEWQRRKDPVLTATKARSWKALAKNGASYSIYQKDDEIRVDMSYTDKKGRWQNDPQKVRIFPGDAPLKEIVQVILDDIQSRPKVF
ncbi:MAG: hypothetical protein BroJett015_47720 [Chloroflexota bacterium]|nr:hypothetical protein [Ardenticatenaceae bacterium]GIK59109.1 MAG: hypothetical protein BroJett015_47720 [Chloroflexota bacterium]